MQHHIVVIPSHHTPCRRVVISTIESHLLLPAFVYSTRTVDLEMYCWSLDIVEADTNIEEKEFLYNSHVVGDYCITIKAKNILVFWVKKSRGLVAGIASFLRGFFR